MTNLHRDIFIGLMGMIVGATVAGVVIVKKYQDELELGLTQLDEAVERMDGTIDDFKKAAFEELDSVARSDEPYGEIIEAYKGVRTENDKIISVSAVNARQDKRITKSYQQDHIDTQAYVGPYCDEINEETDSPKIENIEFIKGRRINNGIPQDVLVDEEDKPMNKKGPRLISFDLFNDDEPDYDKLSFNYFAGDETLTDENEDIVTHDIVGAHSLTQFGMDPDDVDTVFVRNDKLGIDYEVIKDERCYKDVVGIE